MPSTTCIMCAEMRDGLLCTLHGGRMTATEVELRHSMQVVDGHWVRPEPSQGPNPFGPMVDAVYDVLKKNGAVP